MKTYIHYGSAAFDPEKFNPPMNRPNGNKPLGGLWASPEGSAMSWKEWCLAEDFRVGDLAESFRFSLVESAKILHVYGRDDIDPLLNRQDGALFFDFEGLMRQGYDAVEYHIESAWQTLYGWDCDSILVLNPDVIVPIVEKAPGDAGPVTIGVTVELTARVFREIEVPADEPERIKAGDSALFDVVLSEMYDEVESASKSVDRTFDYAVTDSDGRDIVPWN